MSRCSKRVHNFATNVYENPNDRWEGSTEADQTWIWTAVSCHLDHCWLVMNYWPDVGRDQKWLEFERVEYPKHDSRMGQRCAIRGSAGTTKRGLHITHWVVSKLVLNRSYRLGSDRITGACGLPGCTAPLCGLLYNEYGSKTLNILKVWSSFSCQLFNSESNQDAHQVCCKLPDAKFAPTAYKNECILLTSKRNEDQCFVAGAHPIWKSFEDIDTITLKSKFKLISIGFLINIALPNNVNNVNQGVVSNPWLQVLTLLLVANRWE